jgi:hypothetical protein
MGVRLSGVGHESRSDCRVSDSPRSDHSPSCHPHCSRSASSLIMSAPAPASPAAAASPKAPASPQAKRPLEDVAEAPAEKQGPSKKAKAAAPDANAYQLNFNKALDKEHEGKTFNEIIKLPPSALQGLAGKADKMLAHFKINTIEDLGKWKYFHTARAIVRLAEVEEKGKRPAGSKANINKALDKAHEKKSFTQIAKEPVSALQGLAEWADDTLKPLQAGKISQVSSKPQCSDAFILTPHACRSFDLSFSAHPSAVDVCLTSYSRRREVVRVDDTNCFVTT